VAKRNREKKLNYQRIYNEFITDRRAKEAALIASGTYYERHHVTPRSLNGGDEPENLIALTAGDHFFAHLVLAKWIGEEQWISVHAMSFGADFHKRSELFSKRRWFELARKKAGSVHAANTARLHRDPEWAAKVHNEEVNRKRSETLKAWHQTPKGRAHAQSEARIAAATSPEAIARRSAAYREWWDSEEGSKLKEVRAEQFRRMNRSEEFRAGMSGDNHPRRQNPEKWADAEEKMRGDSNPAKRESVRQKMSDSMKRRYEDPEFATRMRAVANDPERRAKIGAAHKGKAMSEDAKEKLRQANLGKKASDEAKLKMSRSRKKPIRCVTTGETFPSTNDAAAAFGVDASSISHVLHGRNHRASLKVRHLTFERVS
jgi:hypothetical protein